MFLVSGGLVGYSSDSVSFGFAGFVLIFAWVCFAGSNTFEAFGLLSKKIQKTHVTKYVLKNT